MPDSTDSNIIIVSPSRLSGTKIFDSWPEGYGTRSMWNYEHNRRVLSKAEPSFVNVDHGHVPIFDISQTRLIEKRQTEFEVARTEFLRRFWYQVRHDAYLYVSDDQVSFIDIEKQRQRGSDVPWLSEQMVLSHLQGDKTYGICARKFAKKVSTTYWLSIDLDLHLSTGGNLDIFRRQLHVLLTSFWGNLKSQLVVSSTKLNGVHLYLYFTKPVPLNRAVKLLQQDLAQIHALHPDLAHDVENWNLAIKANFRTKNWKVKQLDELEIYPSTNIGFRFIGVKGKVVLAEKVIATASWGKYCRGARKGEEKIGFDLKAWWASINTNDRMPINEVMAYVEARLPGASEQVTVENSQHDNSASPKLVENVVESDAHNAGALTQRSEAALSYKGNTKRKLTEFWLGINNPAKSLNSTILVTARLFAAEGLSEDEARDVINDFIRELPIEARQCSSRLQNGQQTALNRDVNKQIHNAFTKPSGFDPETARIKLAETSLVWKKCGFRLSDKKTWHLSGHSSVEVLSPKWIASDLHDFEKVLLPALKIKNVDLAAEVATEVVKLTQMKAYYHQGWGYAFLKAWLPDKFKIKCAKPQKQQEVLAAFRRLQIIQQQAVPVPRVRATIWQLGQRAMARISGDLITEFVVHQSNGEVSNRKLEEAMQALPGLEDSPLCIAAMKREKRRKE